MLLQLTISQVTFRDVKFYAVAKLLQLNLPEFFCQTPCCKGSLLLREYSSQQMIETNIVGISELTVVMTWIISRRHSPIKELAKIDKTLVQFLAFTTSLL